MEPSREGGTPFVMDITRSISVVAFMAATEQVWIMVRNYDYRSGTFRSHSAEVVTLEGTAILVGAVPLHLSQCSGV